MTKKIRVGDVVRISNPKAEVDKSYHNKIGKIKELRYTADYPIRVEFINFRYKNGHKRTCGFIHDEVSKLSKKEALAWLI